MQFRLRTLFAITLGIAVMMGLVRLVAAATGIDAETVAMIYLLAALPLAPILGIIALSGLVTWLRGDLTRQPGNSRASRSKQ